MVVDVFLLLSLMGTHSLAPPSTQQEGEYREAMTYTAQAMFVGSGASILINNKISEIEGDVGKVVDEMVPEKIRFVTGWGMWAYQTMQSKTISYSWEF